MFVVNGQSSLVKPTFHGISFLLVNFW